MSMRFAPPVEHHGVASGREMTTWGTLRRGIQLSPELGRGIGVTVLLAVLSTLGTGPRAVRRAADDRRGHPRRQAVPTSTSSLAYIALALVGVVVTVVVGLLRQRAALPLV